MLALRQVVLDGFHAQHSTESSGDVIVRSATLDSREEGFASASRLVDVDVHFDLAAFR